ncbi:hypothetical protein [Kitasatospora sp. MAP5-34]|uniref:hypothetical protein n=1 Tax=Kitasatospora sp. MAP5-34 TaxID=3035102 RepID=UPI00247558D6|nr:hypothetical protein [Kitasatospora sp. MAP5-34]MDH6579394.1 tetratricopeptide (TPR) repeat protein [Kitasatospora sp. MAP5-34]
MTHSPSCAKRIRHEADAEQWDIERIADTIESCCGVSRLRSHRLARGWTLSQAVTELQHLCDSLRLSAPSLNAEQLRAWEATPRRPRARTIDLLCRLYRTDAQGLGLTGNYRPGGQASTSGAEVTLRAAAATGPQFRHPPVPAGQRTGDSLDALVDSARRAVERTLALTTVSVTQLEVLDERMMGLRRSYVVTPPAEMLTQLLEDLEEIRVLSGDRQPANVQLRLSEMTALVATLIADALMKLGRLHQSQRWYGTARAAADDSGNTELRARVRAQAAMLPYYYGPLDTAIDLARQARLLNRNRPTATGAFAAAAEARALARRGDAEGAHTAIRQAQDLFERCKHGRADDAWAFPERRLYLYLSGAYTYLGETSRARAVQQQAFRLYPDRTGIDPALLHLEEAMCLVRERSLAEACQLAGRTYLEVQEAHRTTILGSRVQDVIDILPSSLRSSRAARELGEILALPAGPM